MVCYKVSVITHYNCNNHANNPSQYCIASSTIHLKKIEIHQYRLWSYNHCASTFKNNHFVTTWTRTIFSCVLRDKNMIRACVNMSATAHIAIEVWNKYHHCFAFFRGSHKTLKIIWIRWKLTELDQKRWKHVMCA